ncbi:retrovirus-related pol polyprotein from transposon TNT 1-94 [Tanacetum coccineum]
MITLEEHIIVAGVENRPPMLEKSIKLQTRPKKYSKLTEAQQLQDDCDVQATNIILHGLSPDVYALVNHQEAAKDIWDRVKLLMNDTKLSYQERIDNATSVMVHYQISECLQRNGEFVTDVKLAKSLYTTNYDQLYAYLSQHERHANKVLTQHSQANFPQLDSGLVVPTFQQGEDPIECINKAMAFQSVVASRFPPSNNQLRTSSNPRNQATIQDGRVTVQQVQGRQSQSFAGTGNRGIATTSRGNYAAGQPRVVKCYNCQGEGHMARQCTQPKRPRNVAWFKEKLMLAEAQEAGQILDEEQLAFLADPGISEAPVAQQTIPQNLAFQTEDLDAYDSDCDDLSLAKAVLMANLSSCDSDVLSEVPYSDSSPNDMINQDVQEMQYSEQTHIDDFQDNKIHSDSNIIPYSQYLQESQDAVIQDTNSSAPNDLLVLSLVEQMTDHVAHLDKENQTNKMVNESLTAELERYKERVAIFEQRQNVDLNKREKLIDSQMDDLIRNRNAKLAAFQQEIDTLKETLSNHVKEKDVIAKEHHVISVIDDEETLILEEESRSKMLDKQNDLISIEKKINISPIDYSKLNKIKEDFDKRFVTKKELSAEQAFWLKHSNYNPDTSVKSHTPVRIEAPSELPKISLVNESLKKLKHQLASFDKVVKKRTTSDAIMAGAWGFEHTKGCSVRK